MVMIAQMKDKKKLREKIHNAVCTMYEEVSERPDAPFHFPVGYDAALKVGYPKDILDEIPDAAIESFAGVGYHFKTQKIGEGNRVLDIGSGSGTDLLVASMLVGDKGSVVGIDITNAMIKKAEKAALSNGFNNVKVIKADAEDLPFEDESFDVVISNGVINLAPDKGKVFHEVYRVLKEGGHLSIADIVLGNPISEESRKDPKLWSECIVGASLEKEYAKTIKQSGFNDIDVLDSLDYFANSRSDNTREVASHYKARSIVLSAKK